MRAFSWVLLSALMLPLVGAIALAADDDQPASVLPNLNKLTDQEKADGWQLLFDGKTTDGWRNYKQKTISAGWKVVDGALMFDGAAFNLSGPLCTVKQYGNFEMLVDWKISKGGDSGIYLRGSPQVQIWDPDDPSQQKNGAGKGSGALWNNAINERFPLVRADNPIGEWNSLRIRMVGDRVSVWLNGKLVTDNVVMENYWERKKPIYPREQIELQNHNHPLYFRNIFIKELP